MINSNKINLFIEYQNKSCILLINKKYYEYEKECLPILKNFISSLEKENINLEKIEIVDIKNLILKSVVFFNEDSLDTAIDILKKTLLIFPNLKNNEDKMNLMIKDFIILYYFEKSNKTEEDTLNELNVLLDFCLSQKNQDFSFKYFIKTIDFINEKSFFLIKNEKKDLLNKINLFKKHIQNILNKEDKMSIFLQEKMNSFKTSKNFLQFQLTKYLYSLSEEDYLEVKNILSLNNIFTEDFLNEFLDLFKKTLILTQNKEFLNSNLHKYAKHFYDFCFILDKQAPKEESLFYSNFIKYSLFYENKEECLKAALSIINNNAISENYKKYIGIDILPILISSGKKEYIDLANNILSQK